MTVTDSGPERVLDGRRALAQLLDDWERTPEETPSLAVLVIGLQDVRELTSLYGSGTGDTLLDLALARIATVTRHGDPLASLGGGEFGIVLVAGAQPGLAEATAGRIIDVLSRPFLVDGRQLNLDVRAGVALSSGGPMAPGDLLPQAELALRAAERSVAGSYRCFVPELAEQVATRRELEVHLRRALGLRELTVVYQPQVQMADGTLRGAEALVRWNSAAIGAVPPGVFIPLAEEIGEIDAIGRLVLRRACVDAVSWPGRPVVSVNVSPRQFETDDVLDVVQAELAASGLPAGRLQLEITEGMLLDDSVQILRRLDALTALGVTLALDDFGTGYSSLRALHRFPISSVKIDQSFVRGEQTARSQQVARAIVALGHALDLSTIAEGVETREQYERLADAGCDEAQGYLIARPMPTRDVAEFLACGVWTPGGRGGRERG